MIIPVVYGKAVLKPTAVYRYDDENKIYLAYIVNENTVNSITVYINGSEYDSGRYTVSYQGDTVFLLPDNTNLKYPHCNSLLIDFDVDAETTFNSKTLDLTCFVDGSVIYDLVGKTTVANYNPINFIYDYLTNTKYGLGIDPGLINTTNFEAEANYAVNYGLINTCEFGVILDDEDASSNLNKLLFHANANLYISDGLICIAINRLRDITFTITDDQIVKDSISFVRSAYSDTMKSVRISTRTVPEWNTRQYLIEDANSVGTKTETLQFDYIEDAELPAYWGRQYIDRNNLSDTLSIEVTQTGLMFDLYDVVAISESELGLNGRYRIEGISYPTAATVKLTLSPDPDSLYDNIPGNFAIGDYTILDNLLVKPGLVSNVQVSENVNVLQDGSYSIVLNITYDAASKAKYYIVEVLNGGITQKSEVFSTQASFKVIPGGADITIVAVSYGGIEGDPYTVSYTVTGDPGHPSNVANLTYSITRNGIVLNWSHVADKDFLRYKILVNGSFWKDTTSNTETYYVDSAGTYDFIVITVNRFGLESSGATLSVIVDKPAAPTSISTSGKLYAIELNVSFTKDAYFEGLEIWANSVNDRNAAFLLTTIEGGVYLHDQLGMVDQYYYWVRVRNRFGIYSDWYPADPNGGVFGTTDHDPSKLLETLQGSVSENQLIADLNSRIDMIDRGGFIVEREALEDGIVLSIGGALLGNSWDILRHDSDIKELTTKTSENLTRIQSLSSEVTGLITDEWNSTTTYSVGKLVSYNGQVWRAIQESANIAPDSPSNFDVNGDYVYWEPSDNVATLVSNLEIKVDDIENQLSTKVNQVDFNQLQNTVSDNTTQILQNAESITLKADKTEVSALSNIVLPEFDASVTYSKNDIVAYNNSAYRALNDIGFTPAPLPTNATYWVNIGALSNAVSTSLASIEIHSDQIALKVNQTDFDVLDGEVNNLNNIVSTHSTLIQQNADNILLKADKTEFEQLQNTVTNNSSQIDINTSDINLHSSVITGTIAVEENIVENGVIVQSVADVSEIDNRISQTQIQLEDANYKINDALVNIDGLNSEIKIQAFEIQNIVDQNNVLSHRVSVAEIDIDGLNSTVTTHASRITTVENDVGTIETDMAAIEQTLTVVENDVGDLQSQYMLKTDVNGYVAGFGLVNEGATSEFAILADKFKIAMPDGSGTPKQAFTVGTINGNTTVGISGDLIIDGTITARTIGTNEIITDAANIKDAVITDAKIQNISADKITAGTIDADAVNITNINGTNIKSTSLITLDNGGKFIAGNNEVIIDTTTNGVITVAEDGGAVSGNNYMTLFSGEISFYYWDSLNSQHVLYNTLKRVESGVASNNTTVNIPGIWKSQPKIFLSPANLQSYDGNYSSQDQSFLLEVTNLTVANGRWIFTPKAQLVLSANSVTNTYNLTAGNTLDNTTFATTAIGSPGSTTGVTAYVKLRSVRGTGTSGQYYYRKVDWRINYGTGASSWKTVSIGSTLDYISDSVAISGLSANSYNISIEAKAYDEGGTFQSGTTQYEYWTGTSNYEDNINRSISIPALKTGTDTYYITMPDPNIPSGYSVYQIDWEIRITQNGGSLYIYDGSGGDMSLSTSSTGTFTKTATSWDRSITISFSKYNNTAYSIVASYAIDYIRATIHARKAVANSTTPDNDLIFEVATFSLAGATILATGTVNWIAIGE